MYATDALDTLVEIADVPKCDCATGSIVMADGHRLVLSYDMRDEPPYRPTTAPLAVIRFIRPYMHLLGPPDEDVIERHPLGPQGLMPYRAYRVDHSSLVRHLASTYSSTAPSELQRSLKHYIFTFQDSVFECLAESYEATVEHVGLFEEPARTLEVWLGRNKE